MIIHTTQEVRPMLLCSRILLAKCQLAIASSHGAVGRLPMVSLTPKHTASSLASGNSNNRCSHDPRARVRARIIKYLNSSALSVVAPAIKPRNLNWSQENRIAGATRPLESSALDFPYITHWEISERAILGAWHKAWQCLSGFQHLGLGWWSG